MYSPLPNVTRARRLHARLLRWNRFWSRYGKCVYCKAVYPRLFFYGDDLDRNVCWGCWDAGKGFFYDHR